MPRALQSRSSSAVAIRPAVRCAIYCRVSTDAQMDKEFNSLEAQRETCENYIASYSNEGWSSLPEQYSDAGISGATLHRPSLQRLLRDN